MKKQEIKDKIAELEKQICKLQKELEDCGDIWKPKEDEKYYFNYGDGETDFYTNDFDDKDAHLMGVGNCYPTRKKAQFEANREKYTRLFRQYVEQHSEPLNWGNEEQYKCYMFYDYENKKIRYSVSYTYKASFIIYASSEQVLKEAIDFVGEDNVKKYILEIGE